jgi:hypothetical protein
MFRWLSPTPKKTKRSLSVRPRRITLHLEALETRDCPSTSPLDALDATGAPVLPGAAQAAAAAPGLSLSLSAAPGPGIAFVAGQVSGGSASGGLTVTLSGVVSASVTTQADGTFTYTGPASGLGQIQASVTDNNGNTATASTTLSAAPPTIVNFVAINNGNNNWTFTGQVQGPYVQGLTVALAGIPSLNNNNASATVQANGGFSYTITLQPGESGGVTADCTDWWGQASNEATAYVSS